MLLQINKIISSYQPILQKSMHTEIRGLMLFA